MAAGSCPGECVGGKVRLARGLATLGGAPSSGQGSVAPLALGAPLAAPTAAPLFSPSRCGLCRRVVCLSGVLRVEMDGFC